MDDKLRRGHSALILQYRAGSIRIVVRVIACVEIVIRVGQAFKVVGRTREISDLRAGCVQGEEFGRGERQLFLVRSCEGDYDSSDQSLKAVPDIVSVRYVLEVPQTHAACCYEAVQLTVASRYTANRSNASRWLRSKVKRLERWWKCDLDPSNVSMS